MRYPMAGYAEWEGINGFHKTIAGNAYVSEAWTGNFTGIARANLLLDQLNLNGKPLSQMPALKTPWRQKRDFCADSFISTW